MNEKFLAHIENHLFNRYDTFLISRRGRTMREVHGASMEFTTRDHDNLSEFKQEEYDQYLEMIQPQIQRFKKYFQIDKFSRRLMIQFPLNWYENKQLDYMPCPESFMVQFLDEKDYIVVCNFRSSETSRIQEDLSIIKTFCEKELGLSEHKLTSILAHFCNAHKYLDGGSSEDFTATTYFEMKEN